MSSPCYVCLCLFIRNKQLNQFTVLYSTVLNCHILQYIWWESTSSLLLLRYIVLDCNLLVCNILPSIKWLFYIQFVCYCSVLYCTIKKWLSCLAFYMMTTHIIVYITLYCTLLYCAVMLSLYCNISNVKLCD